MFTFAKKTLSSITSGADDEDFPDANLLAEQEDSPEALEEKQRQELQTRIIALWQKVWQGLYQVHDNKGQYHYDRLLALYEGAGMSVRMNQKERNDESLQSNESGVGLGLLGVALSRHYRSTSEFRSGVQGLKLYDGLSPRTLESVIELLEAYEREIEPLSQVYTALRRLQIGLRESTGDDEDAVLQQYPPVADPIAKRLLQYDARLDVLTMELYDEGMVLHDDPKLRQGWYVSEEVFPRLRRHGSSVGFFKSGR